MWIAFELLVDAFQAFMMLTFMKNRLHICKRHRYADALCMLSITVFFAIYEFFEIPISDVVVFVIPMIYGLSVADDKWYIVLFWSLVLGVIFMATVSLSLHIFMSIPQISYDDLMNDTAGRLAFVVATNLTLLLILYAASKIKTDISSPAWPALLLFVLMNIALIIVEESVFSLQLKLLSDYGNIDKAPFFLAYVGILLCTLFSILLFHMMSKSADRENRYKMEANTMALSRQHIQELERMYADLRVQRHDFKQHFQALEEMVDLGGNREAVSYLADYKAKLSDKELFMTGCIAVDALLAAKYLTMQKEGLAFRYTAYPLNELPIGEVDFCAILGNILDNAIEGSLRISNKADIKPIHLTFSRSWDMFYIFCTNSCNSQTLQKGKAGWVSSKEKDGIHGSHGIGIRNIERIVGDAEGRCSFAAENNVFQVKVVLPFQPL